MLRPSIRSVLVPTLIVVVGGCSSAGKQPKSSLTASSNPFLSASRKVKQDVAQTETDLGELESSTKVAK